jgi:DNA primase
MSLETIENVMYMLLKASPSSKSGGSIYYHCPFAHATHSGGHDSNPSFNWYEKEKPLFNCYTCGVHGDVAEFGRLISVHREDVQGLEEIHNIERLERYHIKEVPVDLPPLPVLPEIYNSVFDDLENTDGMIYNNNRGISLETSKKLELMYDTYRSKIVFPIKDKESRLLGFSGRSIDSKDTKTHNYMKVAVGRALLGSQFVYGDLPVCIVEGPYDYANIHEIGGAERAIPLALFGASLTAFQEKLLLDFGRPVYVMLDNDKAGKEALRDKKFRDGTMKSLGVPSRLVRNLPTFTVTYPEGIKDPGDLSSQQFNDMLDTAVEVQRV